MIAPRRWFLCLDLSEYVETLKNDSEKLKALLSCIYLVLLKIEDSGSKILVSYCFLGQLLLSGLKTQYFNLKFDTDFFCIRLCSSLHLGKGFFFVFFFFFPSIWAYYSLGYINDLKLDLHLHLNFLVTGNCSYSKFSYATLLSYRGDAAFCSLECREKQMKIDVLKEKYSQMLRKSNTPPPKARRKASGSSKTVAAAWTGCFSYVKCNKLKQTRYRCIFVIPLSLSFGLYSFFFSVVGHELLALLSPLYHRTRF